MTDSLRNRGAALDPEFAFPVFSKDTPDPVKAECYRLFTKFITDSELDKVFIFQDKDTVGGITWHRKSRDHKFITKSQPNVARKQQVSCSFSTQDCR